MLHYTRNKEFDNVYIFKGSPKTTISVMEIDNKITNYMRQDMLADRTIIKDDFIDTKWVLSQSKKQNHQCSCCHDVMNLKNIGDDLDWTVDRNDNDIAHEKTNCTLMCFKCNISKK